MADAPMEIDNYPSVEQQPLRGIELEAKEHWERFCPNLVAQLKAQGPLALETEIRKAWWRMEFLTRLEMTRSPQLHRIQAEELHRTELWLPPEVSETPDTLIPTTN